MSGPEPPDTSVCLWEAGARDLWGGLTLEVWSSGWEAGGGRLKMSVWTGR